MSKSSFELITIDHLETVSGGAGEQPATPAPKITGQDVASTAGAATKAVLNPLSMVGNVGQAYRQFNDPRLSGTGFWPRALNGFTGIVGIDPLKK